MRISTENLRSFDPTARDFRGLATVEGPLSVINLKTHRDEFPSEETYERIKASGLVVERGHVRLTAGNLAARRGQRYSTGGYDLNRMFDESIILAWHKKTPEYTRAQNLKLLWDGFDALLDGHNTSNEFSTPHIITEPQGFEIASRLPINLIVNGFDKYEPGATESWMNQQTNPLTGARGIGICTEAGWKGDPLAADLTLDIIQAFLLARGHVDEETLKSMKVNRRIIDLKPKKHKEVVGIYIAKNKYKTIPKGIKDFEPKEPDDLAGHDAGIPIFVRDADTKGGSPLVPGVNELLFVSQEERDPGQTGFVVVANRPDITSQ